jgi:hypothetical protein
MTTVIFDTEKAAFKFDLLVVSISIQDDSSFGAHKEAVELAMSLEISTEPPKEDHNEKEKPEEETKTSIS